MTSVWCAVAWLEQKAAATQPFVGSDWDPCPNSTLKLFRQATGGLLSVGATLQDETRIHKYIRKTVPRDAFLSECLRQQNPKLEEQMEATWWDEIPHGMWLLSWKHTSSERRAGRGQVLSARAIEAGIYHSSHGPRWGVHGQLRRSPATAVFLSSYDASTLQLPGLWQRNKLSKTNKTSWGKCASGLFFNDSFIAFSGCAV